MTAPSTNAGVGGSPAPSSMPRAASLALSTSGWSNGLMPSSRPATAVAYSHSSSCAPSGRVDGDAEPGRRPHRARTRSPAPTVASTSSGVLGSKFGGVGALDDDRQHARAVLAGGLGDQLLGPVAEAGDTARPRRRAPACRAGRGWRRPSSGAEPQAGVVDVESASSAGRIAVGLVEQRGDVGAGQPARHQAERGQRGVAAADVGVGEEDPVAGLAGRLLAAASRGR